MAFTQEELSKITDYCGMNSRYLDPESIYYSQLVHERLVTDLKTQDETKARELLVKIDAVEEQLTDSIKRYKVTNLPGGLSLDQNEERRLKIERKRLIKRLLAVLALYQYMNPTVEKLLGLR